MISSIKSNRSPGFLNFRLTEAITWLWRWLPHRLSKCHSQITVLLRTPITQMIFSYQGTVCYSGVQTIFLILCQSEREFGLHWQQQLYPSWTDIQQFRQHSSPLLIISLWVIGTRSNKLKVVYEFLKLRWGKAWPIMRDQCTWYSRSSKSGHQTSDHRTWRFQMKGNQPPQQPWPKDKVELHVEVMVPVLVSECMNE